MTETLRMGVNSEPPSVAIQNLKPIPEIICGVNEDKEKIRDNIKKNVSYMIKMFFFFPCLFIFINFLMCPSR